MIDENNPQVAFALETVQQASHMVRLVQREMVTAALTKGDRSPVTVADFASQALVGKLISQRFPAMPLVAEESAATLQAPAGRETLSQVTAFLQRVDPEATPQQVCAWIDRGTADPAGSFWTLDPIDGTKGFLRGDQYAVALAWVDQRQVQIGVLGCPNLVDGQHPDPAGSGSLIIAVRGQGAWTTSLENPTANWQALQVSSCSTPSQARLLRSFEAGHTNVDQVDELSHRLGTTAEAVRMDSQAKYAILAAGAGELIVRLLSPDQPNYREKIWDQAAGSIIVEEAGGQITDLTAGRTLARNRGVLASNRLLHTAALHALAAIGV
jgi:3'(2'), 5'-bisphosphate nucleotidase